MTNSLDLELLRVATKAAADAALRNAHIPMTRPATVVSAFAGEGNVEVLIDGDDDSVIVGVLGGAVVHTGDRVQVQFIPPSGAMVVGGIGRNRATVGRWLNGANTPTPGDGTRSGLLTGSFAGVDEFDYPTPFRVSPLRDGWWTVSATARFDTAATGYRSLHIYQNETLMLSTSTDPVAAVGTHVPISAPLAIESGDNVSIRAEQTSGTALNVRLMMLSFVYLGSD